MACTLTGQTFDRGRAPPQAGRSRIISPELFLQYVKVGYAIADTGALQVICSDKREFVGPIVPIRGSLGGIGDGRDIKGEGEVEWCFQASDRSYVAVILQAYCVPGAKYRLLSPQILCDTLNGTLTRSPHEPLRITWRNTMTKKKINLTFPFHDESNVPNLPVYSSGVKFGMIDVLNFSKPFAASFVTDDANLNLTLGQKILLRLHYCLCHVSLATVQWLVRKGVFGPSAKSAGNCPLPKCHSSCELMKAKRCSSGAATSRCTLCSQGALVSEDLSPSQRILIDFFKSPVLSRGRTSIRGSLSSNDNLVRGMIAVDHASSKIFACELSDSLQQSVLRLSVPKLLSRLRHAIKEFSLLLILATTTEPSNPLPSRKPLPQIGNACASVALTPIIKMGKLSKPSELSSPLPVL